MCYPKPGPRCPKEAKKALARAKRGGDAEEIKRATSEYYQTTEGLAKLRESGRHELADKMAARRAARIQLSKKKAENNAKNIRSADMFNTIPLKEMDSAALTITLMNDVSKTQSSEDVTKIVTAMQIATHLHIEQRRKNRQGMPITPYIEHPLRNTIRLHRMGCADTDTLCATLMHDTMEDCPDKIVREYCGMDPEGMSTEEKREICHMWMASVFSEKTANTVRNVTNPEMPQGLTKPEKHVLYRQHVEESIAKDPETFLVKFSDFNDNASSLPYNNIPGNEGMVSNMAKKYAPLIPVFRRYANKHKLPLSEEGVRTIHQKLNSIERQLDLLLQDQKIAA